MGSNREFSFVDEQAPAGATDYFVQLRWEGGEEAWFGPARVDAVVQGFALGPVRPNPFLAQTTLSFRLPHDGPVLVDIYDVRGRKVRRLAAGPRAAGTHPLVWDGRAEDGSPTAAGLYVARVEFDGRVKAQRIVRLR